MVHPLPLPISPTPRRLSSRTGLSHLPWDPWLRVTGAFSREAVCHLQRQENHFLGAQLCPLKIQARPSSVCPHFKPEEGRGGLT